MGSLPPKRADGDFEKDNVKRLLGTRQRRVDFKTAVFRFSDDTPAQFGQAQPGAADSRAQKLANEADERMLQETGANLPARLAVSMLNARSRGFFFAQIRRRQTRPFSMVLDYPESRPRQQLRHQRRRKRVSSGPTTAVSTVPKSGWHFMARRLHAKGSVEYSDANDQIDISHYQMDVDVRDYNKRLRVLTQVVAEARQPNLRAIVFKIGEDLGNVRRPATEQTDAREVNAQRRR
jgi:hypothetical protein